MPDRSLDTLQLHACVDRLQAGDPAGADDLLRAAGDRLARLARKMLRGYATARRLADTGDVVQAAVIRLLRALTVVRPDSTRSFFNLAAVQMRRELADLSRRVAARPDLAGSPPPESCDSIEVSEDAADLELWGRFHEAVEELPAEEREVVGLNFYHGWTQAQIADLLQVDERTVRRRWRAAFLQLADRLGGRLPGRLDNPGVTG